MEGRSGPWRGYRWRRPPDGRPTQRPHESERPATSNQPATHPGPVPEPDPHTETGPRHGVHVQDKHLERTLLVSGIVYILLLFDVVYAGAATWLDARIIGWIVLAPDTLRAIFGVLFSLPGDRWLLAIIIILVALHAWVKRSKRSAALVAISAFSLLLFIEITKWVVQRARPTSFFAGTEWLPEWIYSTSMAFPSGHSAAPVLVYGLALVALWGPTGKDQPILSLPSHVPRGVLIATIMLAFLPGLGRLIWGVHWVSDVIAGWLLGVAWLAGTLLLATHWRQRDPAEAATQSGEVEPVGHGLGGIYDP